MMHPAAFASVFTLSAENAPAPDPAGSGPLDVNPSCEELVDVLQRVGATVVAVQEHGIMLRARRRLIFVRRHGAASDGEVRDALRAAGVGVGRFVELLRKVRSARWHSR